MLNVQRESTDETQEDGDSEGGEGDAGKKKCHGALRQVCVRVHVSWSSEPFRERSKASPALSTTAKVLLSFPACGGGD